MSSRDRSKKRLVCRICGKSDHYQDSCPFKKNERKCTKCGRLGHTADRCTSSQDVLCVRCGGNHHFFNCPYSQNMKDGQGQKDLSNGSSRTFGGNNVSHCTGLSVFIGNLDKRMSLQNCKKLIQRFGNPISVTHVEYDLNTISLEHMDSSFVTSGTNSQGT